MTNNNNMPLPLYHYVASRQGLGDSTYTILILIVVSGIKEFVSNLLANILCNHVINFNLKPENYKYLAHQNNGHYS